MQRGSGDESTHVCKRNYLLPSRAGDRKPVITQHLEDSQGIKSLITTKLEEKAPWYQDHHIVPYRLLYFVLVTVQTRVRTPSRLPSFVRDSVSLHLNMCEFPAPGGLDEDLPGPEDGELPQGLHYRSGAFPEQPLWS